MPDRKTKCVHSSEREKGNWPLDLKKCSTLLIMLRLVSDSVRPHRRQPANKKIQMKTKLEFHLLLILANIQKCGKHFVVKAVETQAFSYITGEYRMVQLPERRIQR